MKFQNLVILSFKIIINYRMFSSLLYSRTTGSYFQFLIDYILVPCDQLRLDIVRCLIRSAF